MSYTTNNQKVELMTESEKQPYLEHFVSKLQGVGMDMPLSKFIGLNLSVFQEYKKFHIPQKKLADTISSAIGKPVSVSSLAVALSRLNTVKTNNGKSNIVIMEKQTPERFVIKDAKLILGTQKEKVEVIKANGLKLEEKTIDWRGLSRNESISSWILEYKDRLIAINKTGWRWKQISDAINEHLNLTKKISVNTLTSIISLANKGVIDNQINHDKQ